MIIFLAQSSTAILYQTEYVLFCMPTGEVRDRDGHVSYRITGAWDTGLELLSEDGKLTLLHFINICEK